MVEYAGRVVEFLDTGQFKLGVVTKATPSKLQVTDQNGRQRSLAVKSVLVLHPIGVESGSFGRQAEELHERIARVSEEIDTELLWETAREERSEWRNEQLAESYFGEPSSVDLSALYRAVFVDSIRFKVRGASITLRSPEEVETQIQTQRKRREREAWRQAAQAWLGEVLGARLPEADENGSSREREALFRVPEELASLPEVAWAILHKEPLGKQEEVRRWILEASGYLAEDDAAFELLRRCGQVPVDAEPFFVRAGIREEFSGEVEAAARSLETYVSSGARRDFTAAFTFSIDDEDTREVDDAISVEPHEGGLRVGVHIADVSRFVLPGSVLDAEAFRRGTTVYLPTRSATMLPRRLSCELASLIEGELRATMSFVFVVDSEQRITESEIVLGEVRVDRRLDYLEVDALLESESDDELTRALRALATMTASLQAGREAKGALTIRRPELRVRVREGEPELRVAHSDMASQRIVSELMIASNALAAEEARRLELPFIYRSQEAPSQSIEPPDTYDPVRLDELFRTLRRSEFTTKARPHSGLGLDAYTQMTSPIRRLTDLVLQRQFSAHLRGETLPYAAEQLFEVLETAQSVEGDARDVEFKATRYWVLEYLRRQGRDAEYDLTVVRELGPKVLVETATSISGAR